MRSELFEETLKQHKDALTDELEKLGKHSQTQLVKWDIEQNESDYEFYFNAGWNAQQSKVDGLQKQLIDQGQRFNEQAQRVKDLEYKNGELMYELLMYDKGYCFERSWVFSRQLTISEMMQVLKHSYNSVRYENTEITGDVPVKEYTTNVSDSVYIHFRPFKLSDYILEGISSE